jgi:hypothetical protein
MWVPSNYHDNAALMQRLGFKLRWCSNKKKD